MEALSRLSELVSFDPQILSLLSQLRDELGSSQKALDALKDYVRDPQGDSPVRRLADTLKVDTSRLDQFLADNQSVLRLLFGNLAELAERELRWPLQVGTGDLNVELAAELDVDVDGEELDGLITYDASSQALVGLGVEGRVDAQASGSAEVSGVGLSGAFAAGAEVAVENLFLHEQSEGALKAFAEDLVDFKLPSSLNRHGQLRTRGGTTVVPGQWVHMTGTGKISLSGGLSWGRSWVTTGHITERSLDLNAPVEVNAGVSVSARFGYLLEGEFDLLISASPTHEERLRVELSRSRRSRRDTGFTVGANVGITGLDQVGRAVVNQLTQPIDRIVAKVEEEADSFPDLRALVSGKVSDLVDQLLAKTDVGEEIDELVRRIAADGSLAATLANLASEATLGFTGDDLQDLDNKAAEVRDGLRTLIAKYRSEGALLARAFFPGIEDLIEGVEAKLDDLPNLRSLVTGKVDDLVQTLLGRTEVDEQIDRLVQEIAADGGLKGALTQLAENTVLGFVGADLDRLTTEMGKVREGIRKLIGQYRSVIDKVHRALDRAAEIKIGIQFARTTSRMQQTEVDLVFEIDVEAHPEAYKRMIRGDFQTAMEIAQQGLPGVEIISGTFKRNGALEISEQLSITAFGFAASQATLLNQDWDSTVSVNGDLSLGVRGSLRTVDKLFGPAKSFVFFADIRLLRLATGTASPQDTLTSKMSLELALESKKPTMKVLRNFADDLEKLGVTAGPTTLESDLSPMGRPKASMAFSASVVMELGETETARLVEAGAERALKTFVKAMFTFFISGLRRFDVTDRDGLPFLLWPDVRSELDQAPGAGSDRTFTSGESSLRVTRDERVPLRTYLLVIRAFEDLYRGLVSLHGTVSSDPDRALEDLRAANRRMLQSVKRILPVGLFDRFQLGKTLYRTVFELIGGPSGDVDPFAVVRTAEDKTFVYG